MDTLHVFAGFLLALFGYSAAAAAIGRGARSVPTAGDLAVAPGAAVVVLLVASEALGWWLLPVALAGGGLAGVFLAPLRPRTVGMKDHGRRKDGMVGNESSEGPASRAKRLLLRTGDFQGRLLLGLFYFVVLAPFAFVARLVQDPLRMADARPRWLPREVADEADALESHRRPY